MFKGELIYSNDNLFNVEPLSLPVGQLIQLSDVAFVKESEINEHIQECDEITYVVSGSADVYCNGECVTLTRGDIHFVKKGCNHKIVVQSGSDFRYVCVGIKLNFDYEPIMSFTKSEIPDYFVSADFINMKPLFDLLLRECSLNDSSSAMIMNFYIVSIVVNMARLIFSEEENFEKRYKRNNSEVTFYNILKFIDKEYAKIKTLSDIANELSYSEYYISHLFKEKLGVTVKEYLLDKKIAHAIEILKTSSLSIEQIAEYLNFTQTHTFRQSFKKITGMTPTDFRRSINSKK